MKRWTSRDESGWYHLRNVAGAKPTVKMLTQRLGPYEDTGLEPEQMKNAFNETALLKLTSQCLKTTPDRLRALIKAEQEKRLVVLPCKVGDTVYWLDYNREACHDCRDYSSFYGMDSLCDKHYELYPEINAVDDDEHCPKHFLEIVEFTATQTWIFNHRADFGKTVFLTREEAEAALQALKDGGQVI